MYETILMLGTTPLYNITSVIISISGLRMYLFHFLIRDAIKMQVFCILSVSFLSVRVATFL